MKIQNSIKPVHDLPAGKRVIDWLLHYQNALHKSHQRGVLVFESDDYTSVRLTQIIPTRKQLCVFSNRPELQQAVAFSKAETQLGLEAEIVIYDMHSGLNVDVLCVAVGLIKAGGYLLLLCPQDPLSMQDKYGDWQQQGGSRRYFLHYLFNEMKQHAAVYFIKPEQILPDLRPLQEAQLPYIINARTIEQNKLYTHLISWLGDTKQRLFVLTADRGRGKSTLLGQFANEVKHRRQVTVTAPSRAQARVLLNCIDAQTGEVDFIAPDEIIRRQQDIDLLIIDEAAMIPGSLLHQCMACAEKTLLATTTGGYEGTGQGFLLKFMAAFARTEYVHHRLLEPVRWTKQDQLEQFINRTLMFDVKSSAPGINEQVEIEVMSKQQLNDDLDTLKAVYALLISAHYRTRPSDLRQLMDDENQCLLLARQQGLVAGVLLLNQEGGFSEELSHQVFMGRRRPQGHLLAQMITAQAGIKHFACFQGFRVQRITVHEQCRRQGIGRKLIEAAYALVRQNKLDYLGSCFAIDGLVTPFWKRMGFEAVHIGVGKGKSSARQTVVVLKSKNPNVKITINQLRQKTHRDLLLWLSGYCRHMYWRDVRAVLSLINYQYLMTAQERDELHAFIEGFRGLELSQAVLQRFLLMNMGRFDLVDDNEQRLLIEKLLQNKPWQSIVGYQAGNGKKAFTKHIKKLLKKLNEYEAT